MKHKYEFSLTAYFPVPLERLIPHKDRPFPLFIYFELNQHLMLRSFTSVELPEERILNYQSRGLDNFWCPNEFKPAWVEYLKEAGLSETEVSKVIAEGERLKEEIRQKEEQAEAEKAKKKKREKIKLNLRNGEEAEDDSGGEIDLDEEGQDGTSDKASKKYEDESFETPDTNDYDDDEEESAKKKKKKKRDKVKLDLKGSDEDENEESDPSKDSANENKEEELQEALDKKKDDEDSAGDAAKKDKTAIESLKEKLKKKRKRGEFERNQEEEDEEIEQELDSEEDDQNDEDEEINPEEKQKKKLNLDKIKERLKEKKKRGTFKADRNDDEEKKIKDDAELEDEDDNVISSDEARSEEAADAIDLLESELDKEKKEEALKKAAKDAFKKAKKIRKNKDDDDGLRKAIEMGDDLSKAAMKDNPMESIFDDLKKLKDEDSDLGEMHSERVSALAVLIGMGLGYAEKSELGDITMGAMMHDIGLNSPVPNLENSQHWLAEYKKGVHAKEGIGLIDKFKIQVTPKVREIILYHHNVRGRNELVQIVALADLLDLYLFGYTTNFKEKPTMQEAVSWLELQVKDLEREGFKSETLSKVLEVLNPSEDANEEEEGAAEKLGLDKNKMEDIKNVG